MKINFDKSFEKQMMKFGLLPNIITNDNIISKVYFLISIFLTIYIKVNIISNTLNTNIK